MGTPRRAPIGCSQSACVCRRLSAANEKEGICLIRAQRKSNKAHIHVVITYLAPTVSARAIPQLQEFVKNELEPL
jgi:hypothetical protein